MRILLYSFEYPPLGGGVGRSLKALLNEFRDYDDLTIDVVTSSIDGRYHQKQFSPRITLYFLPGPNRKTSFHGQKPIHMLYYTVAAWIFSWKLLFTHCYNLTHFYGFPGGIVSWLFSWKVPYVLSLRGIEVPGYNPQYKNWYKVYAPLAKIIWKSARGITVNSHQLRSLAQLTIPDLGYQYIANGVDTDTFKPVSESRKTSLFTITAGATILGKIKNLDILIAAFARFNSEHPQSRLLLIGSGPQENSLKAHVKRLGLSKAVTFVGRKSPDWIQTQLPTFHVVCLPSSNEGMSNALLEALACGLPIVITKEAGASELLKGNGFRVNKDNPSEITKALQRLFTDRTLRIEMGKKSRKLAESFSWQHSAQLYYDWYKQILGKK